MKTAAESTNGPKVMQQSPSLEAAAAALDSYYSSAYVHLLNRRGQEGGGFFPQAILHSYHQAGGFFAWYVYK